MSKVSHHIFREYDVRGVVGEDLTADTAVQVGRAFGSQLRAELEAASPSVALGHDNRLSSEELAAAFAEGLSSTGARVFNAGLVPTPALYFAVHHFDDVARPLAESGRFDVVCFGHNHRYEVERAGKTVLINPGPILGYQPVGTEDVPPTFVVFDTETGRVETWQLREGRGVRSEG